MASDSENQELSAEPMEDESWPLKEGMRRAATSSAAHEARRRGLFNSDAWLNKADRQDRQRQMAQEARRIKRINMLVRQTTELFDSIFQNAPILDDYLDANKFEEAQSGINYRFLIRKRKIYSQFEKGDISLKEKNNQIDAVDKRKQQSLQKLKERFIDNNGLHSDFLRYDTDPDDVFELIESLKEVQKILDPANAIELERLSSIGKVLFFCENYSKLDGEQRAKLFFGEFGIAQIVHHGLGLVEPIIPQEIPVADKFGKYPHDLSIQSTRGQLRTTTNAEGQKQQIHIPGWQIAAKRRQERINRRINRYDEADDDLETLQPEIHWPRAEVEKISIHNKKEVVAPDRRELKEKAADWRNKQQRRIGAQVDEWRQKIDSQAKTEADQQQVDELLHGNTDNVLFASNREKMSRANARRRRKTRFEA